MVCNSFTASAIRHFECCFHFRERWDQLSWTKQRKDTNDSNAKSASEDSQQTVGALPDGGNVNTFYCWELAEERLQKAVQHLCPHRCFMRAYAPYRDWFSLRKILVHEHTSASIDKIFSEWRCFLQIPATATVKKLISGELQPIHRNSEAFLPRTAFINSKGEIFSNRSAVVKHLLKLDSSKRIHECSRNPIILKQRDRVEPFCPKALSFIYSTGPNECHGQGAPPAFVRCRSGTPYGLLEELFDDDPWKLLLSTIFLNRTSRVQVDTILYAFLQEWPTAYAVTAADVGKMSLLLQPMGMRHRRAAGIIRFSNDYIALLSRTLTASATASSDNKTNNVERNASGADLLAQPGYAWTRDDVLGLFYCGDYAFAAYQLFIQQNWNIDPLDHALQAYVEFQRGQRSVRTQRCET